MAWTTPRTWNAGEVVTAALMNLHVRDNLNVLKTSIWDDGLLKPPGFVRKTADQSFISNTTLADLTDLSFAIGANETWIFQVVLFCEANPSGDFRLSVTGPAAPTGVYFGVTANNNTNSGNMADSTFGNPLTVQSTGSGNPEQLIMNGIIRNGANAGTVQIQGAQLTSFATATRFFADSYLTAWKAA